jgi:hypothetical protein
MGLGGWGRIFKPMCGSGLRRQKRIRLLSSFVFVFVLA